MGILVSQSLKELQQKHAEVKLAVTLKQEATNEARYIALQAKVEREVVGKSKRMAPRMRQSYTPDFATPVKRKKEYRTTTGLRTYHFGWSSVTKSSKPRGGPGTKVYANAAATHIVYIEDGAVARDGHITYIDSSRVESLPNGERYAVSNISTFYQERVEFFELVEKFERENHGDKTTIDFSMNTQMWAAVAADRECDLTVVQAYQAYCASNDRNKKKISLEGSGAQLRAVMTKHGFVVDNPIPNKERILSDGFCFHDGRGGRTSYRLVFELPREFNSDRRIQALQKLCDRFVADGCMFVGVIHSPDSHNDDSNYHIHLDFYDRKCLRLGKNVDNLVNVKDHLKPIIAQEINDGLYENAIEETAWDFTVEREYQSNKKKKSHRPFAAARKSDALREQDYVKKVRERFAEDVNSIAVAAGLGKIYDPRDYATMGVNAPSTKKLGPKQHALEVKGIPTKDGIDNEAAQTVFEMSMIEQAHQDRSRHLDQVQFHWQNVSSKSPPQLDAGKLAVDAELRTARMANDIRRDLDHLALEQERERSRANLVSQRQWKISTSASASAAAKLRSAELAKTADAYIAELDERDTAVTANLAELESFALEYGANQVAMAIAEFELTTRALGIEREIQPSAETGFQAKRINMVKAGILERPKADRSPEPHLAETALPDIAEKNVAHQGGTLALPQNTSALHAFGSIVTEAETSRTTERDTKTDFEPTVVAQSMIVTTYPTMPINSWPDPQHNEFQADDRANVFPSRMSYLIDDSDQNRLQAVDDMMGILPAQMQPSLEPLLVALQDLPSPISEPSTSLIDAKLHPSSSAPGVGLSKVDDSSGGKPPADGVHELVRMQQNAKKDNSAGNRLCVLVEKSEERSSPTDEQNHLKTPTPNGATVMGDDTRKSVGPMTDELRMPQAPRDTLIPTETIKATFPPAPQPTAAVLPSHLMKEWGQFGLNELETFDKIEMAGHSLVSINGVVSFARPEEVTEIERLCLSAFPKTAKVLFARYESDRAAKTDLLNIPPASTVTSPVKLSDFRSKDVPTILTRGDANQKDSHKLNSTMVATPQLTIDRHASLIHRFENAHNDKERYEVAALIRADKIALERMVLRNDPDWTTVDRQYKNKQQIAGSLRGDGGLGG